MQTGEEPGRLEGRLGAQDAQAAASQTPPPPACLWLTCQQVSPEGVSGGMVSRRSLGNAGTWEVCSGGRGFGQRRILAPDPQGKRKQRDRQGVLGWWTQRGRRGQTGMGTEGHRKGRAQEGMLGVIRRKTNLFRGAERVA